MSPSQWEDASLLLIFTQGEQYHKRFSFTDESREKDSRKSRCEMAL